MLEGTTIRVESGDYQAVATLTNVGDFDEYESGGWQIQYASTSLEYPGDLVEWDQPSEVHESPYEALVEAAECLAYQIEFEHEDDQGALFDESK